MSKKLYVGNLPFSTNEDEIRDLFAAYGDVESVNLIVDRETGRLRGFGFVEMNEEGANAAMPVSAGDFVLSGGESAATCLMEAVARLVPGFMGKEASADEESFASGLLEYPQYTRPEVFEGLPVPPELLSGHHAAIAAWRRHRSLETTLARRPDLFDTTCLTEDDAIFLRGQPRKRSGRNMISALRVRIWRDSAVRFELLNAKWIIWASSLAACPIFSRRARSCSNRARS